MLSFLTAAVAVLLATRFPRLRIALLILAFAALVYGTMVRKNAVFATLPMLLWMIHVWRPQILRGAGLGRRLGALAVVAAVFGGTIAVADAAISARYDVRHDSQITQVMLDDLVFTVPAAQIEQHVDNPVIREHLLNAQRVCAEKDAIWDAYWACYGKGEFGSYTSIEDSEEIPGYWTQLVLTRPDRYLEYRLTTYSEFLSRNDLVFLSDFHRNQYGLDYHSPQLQRMLGNYVLHFGQAQLPWLFACWFWLLVSVLGLALWRTWRRWGIASPVTALAGSSLIYLLGYFPVVPAANYRYYYWPAVAGTLILLLIGIAAVRVRVQRRHVRAVGPAGAADAESAADTQSAGSTQQPSSARHSGAAARRESAAQSTPAPQPLRRHRDR